MSDVRQVVISPQQGTEVIARLRSEVDRLAHELAQARENETAAIGYAGDCKAAPVRAA